MAQMTRMTTKIPSGTALTLSGLVLIGSRRIHNGETAATDPPNELASDANKGEINEAVEQEKEEDGHGNTLKNDGEDNALKDEEDSYAHSKT